MALLNARKENLSGADERVRVVNIWNSLPDYMVGVDSVHTFKPRLDKFLA